jgi:hypothetical protein
MHAENEREFELVLGNKQLLGLLFLTFVLLGVFFALGYAMGRNAAPSLIVDPVGPTRPSSGSSSQKPRAAEGIVRPQPASPANADAVAPAEATPQPAAQPSSTAVSGGEAAPVVVMLDPKPGETYLQVTAVKRPEAELLVEVLTRKGFAAGLAPAPLENMFRVLVGPVRGDADQGKLKSDLEQAGFKPIPRRY